MKKSGLLSIAVLASHATAAELLFNNSFENGGLNGWITHAQTGDQIVATTFTSGTDVQFLLVNGGVDRWDIQIFQTGIALKPGRKYNLGFGGYGLEGAKSITVGVGHNGGPASQAGDGTGNYDGYFEIEAQAGTVYQEFFQSWTNASVTDNYARVFVDGGGNSVDFRIAWVSLYEDTVAADTGGSDTSGALVRRNQLGFYPEGSKRVAVIGASGDTLEIRNAATGSPAWTGRLGSPAVWPPSGETVRMADFSGLKLPGTYDLYLDGKKHPSKLSIAPQPLRSLCIGALKSYYFQRVSTALSVDHAGQWQRPAGHPDVNVIVHSSAGSGTISSPKGWYDAGDWGKYVVNAGISVYTLLALHEHFPTFTSGLNAGIPESGNTVPDILNEVRWELDWMLTMQATDGGVYHKLTPLVFDPIIMPHQSTLDRYVLMKSTAATLDFAAVTAMGSRLYKAVDAPFSTALLQAATKAYGWAKQNPAVVFVQPADDKTGGYPDNALADEKFWAAIEMHIATGEAAYLADITAIPVAGVPSWPQVSTLGIYSLLAHRDLFQPSVGQAALFSLRQTADALVSRQAGGYGIAMDSSEFYWGSNSVAANQGMLLLHAAYALKDSGYRIAAEQQIDYLLGRNPKDISYTTGFGERSPLHPHHRISEADGIAAPVPGLLVGGPNTGGEDIPNCPEYRGKPALSWIDNYCSFASNEVAINWNAPLVYLAGALEALHAGEKVRGFQDPPTTTTRGRARSGPDAGSRRPFLVDPAAEYRIHDLQGKVVYRGRLDASGPRSPAAVLQSLDIGVFFLIRSGREGGERQVLFSTGQATGEARTPP